MSSQTARKPQPSAADHHAYERMGELVEIARAQNGYLDETQCVEAEQLMKDFNRFLAAVAPRPN